MSELSAPGFEKSVLKKELHVRRPNLFARRRSPIPELPPSLQLALAQARAQSAAVEIPSEATFVKRASPTARRTSRRRRQPIPELPPSIRRALEQARAQVPASVVAVERPPVSEPVLPAEPVPPPEPEAWPVAKRDELWVAEALEPEPPSPIEEIDAVPDDDFLSPAEETVAGPAEDVEPATPEPKKPSLLKRELHLKLPRPALRLPARQHRVQRIVGLRVGSSQLAAAEVHNNGSVELVQLARAPLDHGLVVAGEVREPEALAVELKAFFAKHKLPKRDIRLGIASNRIGVRVLEVPAIDDPKAFANAIRFRAQELLPIPVTDAVLDHVILGEDLDPNGEPIRRVLLVFAHRELVSRYVDVCRKAGLRLSGIDFDAFALLRSLSVPGEPSTDAVVAVAIGHERTVFAVSDGKICDFTRVLEWGSGTLDIALARALDLTPSQAAPIKHELSLVEETVPSGLSAVQAAAGRAAIRSELGVLARELLSSLTYYQTRPGSLDISELLLSGGGAQLDGLAAELERAVGAPVRIGDPLARVQLGKKVSRPADAGSFAIAVGLGIED